MLFGVPSRVVSGVPDSVLPLFHEEDYAKVRRFFARIDGGEKIVSASFQMQAVNGYAPYLRYTFTTAFDENGQPVKAYAVAEDITAQKRAEDDFNATVQALLAANPNALCSYKLNLSQNLCSEEHGVSGYIRNLLRSDTADQLFASLLSIIPDPRQQENAVRFFDRKGLLKRFDAGDKTLHLDYQRRGENGRILWVRTFVNMLKNPGTEDVTAVFYSEDITSEKRNSEIFRIITNREYDYVGLLHPQTAQMEFVILNATLPQKYGDAFGQPGRLYDFDQVRRFAADNWIDPADHEYFWEASSIPHVKAELEQKGHSELSVRGHYTGHPEKIMCRKIQHYYLGEDEDAILVIQTDVTATYLQQQKEAEQARAEAQRVEDIIDSVATGICVFRMPDADHLEGEFVNLQMFRIIGLTPPDSPDARQKMMEDPMVAAYMKDAFLAVHPEDIAKVRRAFHDGYNSQHFTAGDYRILKKDGSSVWINQNATLREIRPDCHVFYATYRVVDREMQLQAELHQQLEEARQLRNQADEANAAKSDFLSRMSHDIRTPLNGIIGMTYLTREMDLPAAARENLDKIDTSSKFLLSLINEVLDMSKAESGKIELHPEPYDPSVFYRISGFGDCAAVQGEEHPLRNRCAGDDTVMPMMDTLRINQIFFNLLSNAVKFTPEGGTITYRLHEHQTRPGRLAMEAEVLDNGIGMSPEFQKHLFEPFSQEMRNDNSNIRGTGLGLAIVKKLLDLMGCTITVRSTPGQGTSFRICGEFDCVPAAGHRCRRNPQRRIRWQFWPAATSCSARIIR
jgi:signal transduction histidine kinase